MKLTFNSVTSVMMSQTVTAIISKFVIQKLLTVNQTLNYYLFFVFN